MSNNKIDRDIVEIVKLLVGQNFTVNTERTSLEGIKIVLLYNLTYENWEVDVDGQKYIYKIDPKVQKLIESFVANAITLGAEVHTSFADVLGYYCIPSKFQNNTKRATNSYKKYIYECGKVRLFGDFF